ncbi:MAG: hypothetical protein ACR2NP_03705 [Pirellulaceae bacterium]
MASVIKLTATDNDLGLAINNSTDTIEYRYVDDEDYDDWWDNQTPFPPYTKLTVLEGVTVWIFKSAFGILPVLIEPADSEVAPYPPQKGCLCNGEWWTCDIGNPVNCADPDPCNGTKIVADK